MERIAFLIVVASEWMNQAVVSALHWARPIGCRYALTPSMRLMNHFHFYSHQSLFCLFCLNLVLYCLATISPNHGRLCIANNGCLCFFEILIVWVKLSLSGGFISFMYLNEFSLEALLIREIYKEYNVV